MSALQRVQRQAPLLVPLGARDLRAAEAAGDHDLHALGAEAERGLHRLLHRAAERDAALELPGDRLGDELRVELGALDLLDVDVDLASGHLGEVVAQLVDLGALAADDDARPRGVDRDPQLVGGALDVDLGDAGVAEALLAGRRRSSRSECSSFA